ncbi:hypothetical protein Tco_0886396 [Tanacetum coccineum]
MMILKKLILHEEIHKVDHHEKLVFLGILQNLEKCLENVLVLVLMEYLFMKHLDQWKLTQKEIAMDGGVNNISQLIVTIPSVFVVHPGSVAARINERKCKTRGGSSRPLVKRKLASGELKAASIKCEDAMAEFDQNPAILVLRENISSLTADVKGHKGNLDRMMLESQKWAGYQVTLSTLEPKVDSLEAKKARLEAVEASLHREVKELKLVGTLVSSAITYGRCRAYEQVAAMKEPFDLSKAKGYRTLYKKDHTQASNDFATATFLWLDEFVADSAAPIEALLLKKPPML